MTVAIPRSVYSIFDIVTGGDVKIVEVFDGASPKAANDLAAVYYPLSSSSPSTTVVTASSVIS